MPNWPPEVALLFIAGRAGGTAPHERGTHSTSHVLSGLKLGWVHGSAHRAEPGAVTREPLSTYSVQGHQGVNGRHQTEILDVWALSSDMNSLTPYNV